MSNIILRIYVGFLAVSVLVMAFMLVTFKRDVSQREVTGGYQVLKDYGYNREHSQYTDKFSPLGVSEEYIFHFDKVEGSYRELLFYTVHQNVDVYVDGVRIYRMKPYISNEFGRTPGCVWNGVVLEDEDAGKEIKVVLYPVYRSSVGLTPQFYFGERYDISLDVIFSQLPALLLSVAGILLGILFVGYGFYNFRSFDADEGLLMLGCFAVIIGTWKLLDNEATCLLFADSQALYMAAFLLLHLACVPFVSKIEYLSVATTRASIARNPKIIVNA